MGVFPLYVDKLRANTEICNANMSKIAFWVKNAQINSKYIQLSQAQINLLALGF